MMYSPLSVTSAWVTIAPRAESANFVFNFPYLKEKLFLYEMSLIHLQKGTSINHVDDQGGRGGSPNIHVNPQGGRGVSSTDPHGFFIGPN